ncbi:hypothetical protein [Sulfolobus acidocaldarius]|uniref:Conserved membrane protein n=4 Tax=Sulfolobus acidocaldarius TaxID=2285 RepID=F2Z5W8_SULAC|nr:hypothetical protein [Sulfolobus acidocaldarius]AAY81544.1 conserved membrane protein [Sulfolobus acidocaldarius DSM 639]AGE72147.1 hypothetical protein SacN8_11005 [Sulfolobus acidocaldarius N8]AGE74464.1 hypothetical protein SacRon12I_11250 [Sulfolobus acidocaldarius Ron12/I]ALU29680.1 quinol oxidase subunit 2 [Sulfolobus acidocaldarius]ALU32415.1 quinol oxidase subunit 2 [Sulfolobus acidocaldarius]
MDANNRKRLTLKDYIWWVVTVVAFFVAFEWVGDFGKLAYLTSSPISSYVENLYTATYLAAGIVFAIFMGSIVFLAVRFRAPSTTTEVKRISTVTYYYIALVMDLIAGVVITYLMMTISYEFLIGALASADVFVFGSIIYLIYKMYFTD